VTHDRKLNFAVIADPRDSRSPPAGKEKTRIGSRVRKKYDEARIPYHRTLDFLSKKDQAVLKKQYESLNPAELRRKIDRLQDRIWKINLKKRGGSLPQDTPALEYIST
jgi:hypothetical protein